MYIYILEQTKMETYFFTETILNWKTASNYIYTKILTSKHNCTITENVADPLNSLDNWANWPDLEKYIYQIIRLNVYNDYNVYNGDLKVKSWSEIVYILMSLPASISLNLQFNSGILSLIL